MATWRKEAADELKRYAVSSRRGAGRKAGQLYQFAKQLTPQRAIRLPKLTVGNPEIRWWDLGDVTIYFRLKPLPVTVLKIGVTKTPKQRSDCENDARRRC